MGNLFSVPLTNKSFAYVAIERTIGQNETALLYMLLWWRCLFLVLQVIMPWEILGSYGGLLFSWVWRWVSWQLAPDVSGRQNDFTLKSRNAKEDISLLHLFQFNCIPNWISNQVQRVLELNLITTKPNIFRQSTGFTLRVSVIISGSFRF
jgi:hypothetical protein